jgi:KDO2-lipid IV(A) lauroyltransferase
VDDALSPQPLISQAGPFSRALAWGLAAVVGAIPVALQGRLARAVGRLVFALGIRRTVTLDNLAQAFPALPDAERRRIARGAYANMVRVIFEAFSSNTPRAKRLARTIPVEGWDAVARALAAGKGALVASAHFGSWELFGEVLARRQVPLSAVVRPLKGGLNAVLVERRLEAGMKLIPPRGAVPQTLKALHRGDLVAMLVDQVLPSKKAVFVPFFGRLAATSPALAFAALRSGAPVFVATSVREGDALRLSFEGPLEFVRAGSLSDDVTALTAAVTARLEATIRRHPDQWLWLHRRWKVAPPEAPPLAPGP